MLSCRLNSTLTFNIKRVFHTSTIPGQHEHHTSSLTVRESIQRRKESMDQQDEQLCAVRVVYAPLPEESLTSSGALDFATRAAGLLPGIIDPSLLPDHIDKLKHDEETEAKKSSIWLFVVSCAADGSVHRNVRKFMRSLKDRDESKSSVTDNNNFYALALLGHARCDNSSKQMDGTIYGTGRKFDKALSAVFSSKITFDRCETQAELEGPETLFDPWVKTLLAPETAPSE
mmetsp:Transcript_23012/g.38038  ORF Transcript_23012/g.38038 Transcript_23012/m.38038 type:complete len:230 (-) Transcript_23012:183-872(-)